MYTTRSNLCFGRTPGNKSLGCETSPGIDFTLPHDGVKQEFTLGEQGTIRHIYSWKGLLCTQPGGQQRGCWGQHTLLLPIQHQYPQCWGGGLPACCWNGHPLCSCLHWGSFNTKLFGMSISKISKSFEWKKNTAPLHCLVLLQSPQHLLSYWLLVIVF